MLYYKPTIQIGRKSSEKSISLQRLQGPDYHERKSQEIKMLK